MSNQIVSNFLTPEEIRQISDIVYHELETRERVKDNDYEAYHSNAATYQPWFGRLQLHDLAHLIPKEIMNKALNFSKEHWIYPEYPMEFTGVTFMRWSNEFKEDRGNPFLGVHLDSNNNLGILLDYQLKSNTDWPLAIEKDVYEMKDNDMVYFYPTDQYHWRVNKNWLDGEFVDVLFFEYGAVGKPRTEQDEDIKKELADYRDSLGTW